MNAAVEVQVTVILAPDCDGDGVQKYHALEKVIYI
jgi:hypothetical protein